MKQPLHRVVRKLTSLQRSQSPVPTPEPEPEIQLPTFTVHLNSPTSEWVTEKTVTVSGWLLANGDAKVRQMRVKNNEQYHILRYGLKRHDVAKAYLDLDPDIALHSGFTGKFAYQEGSFEIEADLGQGWQTVRSMRIQYSPEDLVGMLYNPDLAINDAEHRNLISNKQQYYHEPAMTVPYNSQPDDTKLVAFYLPQFHPIPENDKAWGTGFTEWTNVASGRPRFVGHQQPNLPADLGFYDLRLVESIEAQVKLAQKHGLHGFCFYYYWFSGDRLLEKPLDIFLKHKEWDFNFMIAWANENWTKRWDGLDQDVIIAQKYLKKDPLQFIKDVEPILLDPRYIRHDGKPVLVVYRAKRLDDPSQYVKVWRQYFRETHGLELHLVCVLGLDIFDPTEFGFDAGLEFEPLTIAKRTDFNEARPQPTNVSARLLDQDFKGGVADYRQVALPSKDKSVFAYPTHKSVMPSWDNDARKKGKDPTIFYGANPDIYAHWLDNVVRIEKKRTTSPLIFVNAWNEWAEGAILEPSKLYGHAYLRRTTEVLAGHSSGSNASERHPLFGLHRSPAASTAVIVHVYYRDEWRAISRRLKLLTDESFDLYVTITAKNKELIAEINKEYPKAVVCMVPNRGRDVLPFVFMATRIKDLGYQKLLKLHTKKSLLRTDGKKWFDDMIQHLLPTAAGVMKIQTALESGTDFIGPEGHFVSLERYIGSNEPQLERLLIDMFGAATAKKVLDDKDAYGYFGGSMFWCRFDAIRPLLDLYLIPEDFEAEKGQIDGTFAHAVERVISLIPAINGKMLAAASGRTLKPVSAVDAVKDYSHAP